MLAALLVSTSIGNEAAAGPPGPGLGQAVERDPQTHAPAGVMADGFGLPAGQGNARTGRDLFAHRCAGCHGPDATGGSADRLAGTVPALDSDDAEKTIGNFWPYAPPLFDFIRRAMPMDAPGSLSDDEAYALTAFLLYRNGLVHERQRLDAARLARIRMPNRDGFIDVQPGAQSR